MSGTYQVLYHFKDEAGEAWAYKVTIDDNTGLLYVDDSQDSMLPDWTRLEFHQCSNCPLSSDKYPHCPVAKNLYHLVDKTVSSKSFESFVVTVQTKERQYKIKTDLQSGLFSLMGLVMASSDCPNLSFLRPMAQFHLPIATVKETLFKVVSLHLVRQFLRKRKGLEHNFDLDELLENYNQAEIVNRGILDRIKSISKGDAGKNAIVALNIFAQMFASEFVNDFEILNNIFLEEFKKDNGGNDKAS